MKKENGNVIRFLDNATCHPEVTFSDMKIAWLLINTTSVLEPMDMGVHTQIALQTISDAIFDFEYRRSREPLRISKICTGSGSYELDRVGSEENESRNSKKCFAKAGFGESEVADHLEKANENIAAIFNLCRGKGLSCDIKDFVQSDDHLATYYSFESAAALPKGKVVPVLN
jgi:hypothetical protein